jgi:leucyl aminopeptidase (aminopeptidase T)
MFEIMDGIRSILEACETVKPNSRVLVIADNEGKSMWLGQLVMNIADSMGASEATLIILNPPEMRAQEPPAAVAAAMKCADSIVRVSDKAALVHTTARKEATAVGARYQPIENIPWEDIKKGVSIADIKLIKGRTEALAQLLAQANAVTVTTPAGTNLSVSLAGRGSLSIHPLSPVLGGLPYYAEAAAPPVEGTAEGIIVVDIAFIDWDCVLRKPVRFTVEKGKVVDVSGSKEDADKLRKVFANYENANNIAELGIGTSHVIPLPMHGTRRDAGRLGTAHFALGRNNDFGGETWSEVHWDALMDKPTIELDGKCIMKDGKLLI